MAASDSGEEDRLARAGPNLLVALAVLLSCALVGPAAAGQTPGSADVIPTREQVARAGLFAEGRAGIVSFAVVDTAGSLHCHFCWRRYVSASVVKAILLVAELRRLASMGASLTASERALLDPMIRVSDNAAASAVYWRAGGEAALYGLARAAGMRRFDVSGSWGSAQITAQDQARFFSRLNALTPARFRGYARSLLGSVVSWQSWGIPEVSRPGWRTLFKGGWRGTALGQLVHQVARLERDGTSMAIAVLTDGNPSHAYGRATVWGVAARLLRFGWPGKPWPLPVPAWFWAWARWYLHRGEFADEPFRSAATRPRGAPLPLPVWGWVRLGPLVTAP